MKGFSVLMVSTFLIGFATGIFAHFKTLDAVSEFGVSTKTALSGFEIMADEYGECSIKGVCTSFRIASDKTFIHVLYPRNNQPIREEGSLDDDTYEELIDAVRKASVDEGASGGVCNKDTTKVRLFRYHIRIGDVTSTIDTCVQPLDEPLASMLESFAENRSW